MTDEPSRELDAKLQAYWRKNVTLIRNLLVIWALVSLVGAIILAKPLANVPFFGVTLSFWLAHQGSIIVFVILIFYYAVKMDRLDREYTEEIKTANGRPKGVSM